MKNLKILMLVSLVLLLSGCADNVSFVEALTMEAVGFWYGLWHGTIAVIAFIWHWFDNDVAVYAIYNSGGWYDFGFLIGIGAFASTSCTTSFPRK